MVVTYRRQAFLCDEPVRSTLRNAVRETIYSSMPQPPIGSEKARAAGVCGLDLL